MTMWTRRHLVAFAFGLGIAVSANPAKAGYLLELGSLKPDPGGGPAVALPVFLTETPGTSILATQGLISAGFVVSFTYPGGNAATRVVGFGYPTGVNTMGGDLISLDLTHPATPTMNGTAEADWFLIASPPIKPTMDSSIFLGQFIINPAFNPAGGGSTFSLVGIAPGDNQFLTGNGVTIDSQISVGPSRSVFVPNVTPEPMSLIQFGLGLLGVLGYAGRRLPLCCRLNR